MAHLIPLTGFLGAGKTTTIKATAERLEARGDRVAVITNDQDGDLIDTLVLAQDDRPVAEVSGGCFCCQYGELHAAVEQVNESSRPKYIVAEAVGSCTDITATVVRPIRQEGRHQLGPLIAVVDPIRLLAVDSMIESTRYLFECQLADADLLAINKIDLLGPDNVATVRARIAAIGKPFVFYSARTGLGLDKLIAAATTVWDARQDDLDIDYERYAVAEADLAWLNLRFTLHSAHMVSGVDWLDVFLAHVGRLARQHGWEIGHVKAALRRGPYISKASLTGNHLTPQHDNMALTDMNAAVGLINARIACSPAEADDLVAVALAAANGALSTSTQVLSTDGAFAPAAPQPTHRILAAR